MKCFGLVLCAFGLLVIGCEEPAKASTPPGTIVIYDDAPAVTESPAPIVIHHTQSAAVSVYESSTSPRVRSRTVTRIRVERSRRSGGSAGLGTSYGSSGSSPRRTRRVERSVSNDYGSAGGVSASVSYGSTGGR